MSASVQPQEPSCKYKTPEHETSIWFSTDQDLQLVPGAFTYTMVYRIALHIVSIYFVTCCSMKCCCCYEFKVYFVAVGRKPRISICDVFQFLT
ncbi:hypothetical protein AOLI_G00089600 [Acnodon oligacanthus]